MKILKTILFLSLVLAQVKATTRKLTDYIDPEMVAAGYELMLARMAAYGLIEDALRSEKVEEAKEELSRVLKEIAGKRKQLTEEEIYHGLREVARRLSIDEKVLNLPAATGTVSAKKPEPAKVRAQSLQESSLEETVRKVTSSDPFEKNVQIGRTLLGLKDDISSLGIIVSHIPITEEEFTTDMLKEMLKTNRPILITKPILSFALAETKIFDRYQPAIAKVRDTAYFLILPLKLQEDGVDNKRVEKIFRGLKASYLDFYPADFSKLKEQLAREKVDYDYDTILKALERILIIKPSPKLDKTFVRKELPSGTVVTELVEQTAEEEAKLEPEAEEPPMWNIFLFGHGALGRQVAGLEPTTFSALIGFLNYQLNTHLLYYLTCEGGDINAQIAYESLYCPTRITFPIIRASLTSAFAYSLKGLNKLYQACEKRPFSWKEIAIALAKYPSLKTMIGSSAQVRFPNTETWIPVIELAHIQTAVDAKQAFKKKSSFFYRITEILAKGVALEDRPIIIPVYQVILLFAQDVFTRIIKEGTNPVISMITKRNHFIQELKVKLKEDNSFDKALEDLFFLIQIKAAKLFIIKNMVFEIGKVSVSFSPVVVWINPDKNVSDADGLIFMKREKFERLRIARKEPIKDSRETMLVWREEHDETSTLKETLKTMAQINEERAKDERKEELLRQGKAIEASLQKKIRKQKHLKKLAEEAT